MRDRLEPLVDLLLGAARADGKVTNLERVSVRTLVCDLVQTHRLPQAIQEKLNTADGPAGPTVTEVANPFLADDRFLKRRLLEFVALIRDVDGDRSPAEDDYICALAEALGLEPSLYSDLVPDRDLDALRPSFDLLRWPKLGGEG